MIIIEKSLQQITIKSKMKKKETTLKKTKTDLSTMREKKNNYFQWIKSSFINRNDKSRKFEQKPI